MAVRKKSQGRASAPGKLSFQQQIKALVPPPNSKPQVQAKPPKPSFKSQWDLSATAPSASFRELIDVVAPIPKPNVRVQVDSPSPNAPVREVSLPPRPKLWVEEVEGQVWGLAEGVSRRACQDLELGRIVPRRELDLHRVGAVEARHQLAECVALCRLDNIGCLLVLVGRGSHSGPSGAVLPDVVVQHLAEVLAGDVLALASAPRKWGGQGALLVLLKPKG